MYLACITMIDYMKIKVEKSAGILLSVSKLANRVQCVTFDVQKTRIAG